MAKARIRGVRTITSCIKNYIKEHRMAKGLSQGKLERLTLSAHPYISNCEKQDQQPSVNKFAMLCIALDCEPKDLVAFDFEPIETLIKQYKQDHKPLE